MPNENNITPEAGQSAGLSVATGSAPNGTPRSNAACAAWESGEGNGPSVSLNFAQKLEREITGLREALASCYALAQNMATNDLVRRHGIKEVVDDALGVNPGARNQELEDDVSTATCPVCDGGHGNDCACSCPPNIPAQTPEGQRPGGCL